MDISFSIQNQKGDQVMVALSCYDYETIALFSSDILTLTLVFYDVALVRMTGENFVDYKILFAVSDILAKFMEENDNAVLCFYCDADTDVPRNHTKMSPQEYRSNLFSRMFEMYIRSKSLKHFVNHRIEIENTENPLNTQFAHFICRTEHKEAVINLGKQLMHK